MRKYNASTRAVRLSTKRFPKNKKMQKELAIPLTVMITPFAQEYNPEEFPTTSFGAQNPVPRCVDCRTYVNPFTEFSD